MSYFFDNNKIRYQLYKTNSGENLNWIFLPGGPGADSSYLKSLVETLKIQGNQWLIDLPGNGGNKVDPDYPLDQWFEIFPKMISRFENAIIVGHSFGAMITLMFPELESKVLGVVALNSAPSLWMQEAATLAVRDKLPDLTQDMNEFVQNPNEVTFRKALSACLPYYFPEFSMKKGSQLLDGLPFQFKSAGWWQQKVMEISYRAKWVPEAIPMLIIGGALDYITPFSIFENDGRFAKANIKMINISEAGHMPWIEQPEQIRDLFLNFEAEVMKLLRSRTNSDTRFS